MQGNLVNGFSHMLSGFKLIFQPGLRLFILVPIVANIALFVLLFMWAKSLFSEGMTYLMSWIPEWLGFIEWAFWLIYFAAMVMLLFYAFVSAANLIGAPFYGFLAEVVEQKLSGKRNDEATSWLAFVKLIPRTILRELQKLMYYLPRVLLLVILGLIPGVNAIIAVIWIGFSAWMMAVQYIDYPVDNNGLSFKELRRYLGQHRVTAFGFGCLAFGFTLLPIVNIIALPAAVCGAVAFWVNEQTSDSMHVDSSKHLSQG
jgi:CysZ protein